MNVSNSRGMGSGAVSRNVLHELVTQWDDEIVALIPDEWPEDAIAARAGVHLVRVPAGAKAKFKAEIFGMRSIVRKHAPQKLFSLTDTSSPRPGVPHLLLIQQPYLAYRPSDWNFPVPKTWAARFKLMDAYFRMSVRTVTRFTVQTHAMKNRLADRWKIAPGRIVVIPSTVPAPQEGERWTGPGDGRRFVFFPSHADPHKNHRVLPAMMAGLRNRGVELRCKLTVREREMPDVVTDAAARGVLDMFEFLGRVKPEEVATMLREAVALVNPSKLESFGLPYYEAMRVGCPIVACDLDFAREACEGAALYFAPDEGDEAAEAVARLAGDPGAARELSERGLARFEAVHRPWRSVAADYRSELSTL